MGFTELNHSERDQMDTTKKKRITNAVTYTALPRILLCTETLTSLLLHIQSDLEALVHQFHHRFKVCLLELPRGEGWRTCKRVAPKTTQNKK